MHAAPLPARAPLISRRFLRSFPFNLHGAGRPPTFLIPYRSLRSLSVPSPARLRSCASAGGAGLRRSGHACGGPAGLDCGLGAAAHLYWDDKAPSGWRGRGCAASDYHQDFRNGTAAGAAVPITLLTWWSLMSSCRVPSLLDFGLRVSGSVSSAPLVLCWLIRYSCFVRLEHPSHT